MRHSRDITNASLKAEVVSYAALLVKTTSPDRFSKVIS